MFGTNALEDDDLKNSLSPTVNKQQKLFDDRNITNPAINGSNVMNLNNMKSANMDKLFDESLF